MTSLCDASLTSCTKCCAASNSCTAAMDCCSGARTLSVNAGGYCGDGWAEHSTQSYYPDRNVVVGLPAHHLRHRRRRRLHRLRRRLHHRRRLAAVAVAVANATRKSNVESAATGSAYRALKLLVESMCGDPALLRCGLEKVWAEDGTVEWVAPESKERFVRDGADCLIWNRRGRLEPDVVEVCGRME